MFNANSSGNNAFGGAGAGANTNPLGGGLFGGMEQDVGTFPIATDDFLSGKPLGTGAFGGGGTTNPLAPAPSGGLFASNSNASATAATPSNMFGSAPTGTAPASGGLFGNTANANNAPNTAAPSSTGGLFGNFAGGASTPAGGSAFGAPSSIGQSTGAFGGNNAAGPGTAPTPSGGLFGSSAAAPQASGGLFGSSTPTPAPPTGGLFGSSTPAPAPQAGGGLFGSSTPAQPAQTGGLFGGMPPPVVPAATGGTNPLLAGFGAPKPIDQTQSTTPKPTPSSCKHLSSNIISNIMDSSFTQTQSSASQQLLLHRHQVYTTCKATFYIFTDLLSSSSPTCGWSFWWQYVQDPYSPLHNTSCFDNTCWRAFFQLPWKEARYPYAFRYRNSHTAANATHSESRRE